MSEEHDHDHDHGDHNHDKENSAWKNYLPVIVSFIALSIGLIADHFIKPDLFTGWIRVAWYVFAYLPVGLPVALQGFKLLYKGEVFTEFFLMTIATLGAFYIGEYPEGVAVMLFYSIGELFQDAAVNRAKRSIKALMEFRPDKAMVLINGIYTDTHPEKVKIGDTIQVKAGEKVPLDGKLITDNSSFNTAALTGESKPSTISKGESVMAGMINEQKLIEIEVTKLFNDSSLSRILKMVKEAIGRKAKAEQFIRKFARIYTPIVVFMAIGLTFIPYFIVEDYVFNVWLYRALIFLVISCPCALVISIPLGYFGGIGAGSANGILFKGSNFMDLMTRVNTVVMDKTGTLTKGVFKVTGVRPHNISEKELISNAASIEQSSTHPVAKAITQYNKYPIDLLVVKDVEEIAGQGLKGLINNKGILAGNTRLLKNNNVSFPAELEKIQETIVIVAIDNTYAGYITISDEIKEDAADAIKQMHALNIRTVMLSGDKQSVVDSVAKELGISEAFGGLLPEHKVQKLEEIKKNRQSIVAFAGDGINDAPVLALSDIGIAMGALGSDAAIETADVIIQTDQPSKILTAIRIGKATNRIIWQNIAFAFGVKLIVLALGAGGIASMWEAVFADVGVALLAILNAVRIQKMSF